MAGNAGRIVEKQNCVIDGNFIVAGNGIHADRRELASQPLNGRQTPSMVFVPCHPEYQDHA